MNNKTFKIKGKPSEIMAQLADIINAAETEKTGGKVEVKRGDIVTIVNNDTGRQMTGILKSYTQDKIELVNTFDAKQVHFKAAKYESN